MDTTPFKCGIIVDVLWDTFCETGMIWLQWMQHIKLQVVNIGKNLWTRTQMTVLQMVSSTVTTKPQGLKEFISHEAYDHFGIWHPKCFSAKGQTVTAHYYKQYFQYHLCHAVRKMHSELVQNVIIMCGNATVCSADTAEIVLLCWGWEVLQHPSYFPDLGPCDYVWFPNWSSHCMGNILAIGHLKGSLAWGGVGWHVGQCRWCLPPSLSLAANHSQPQGLFARC